MDHFPGLGLNCASSWLMPASSARIVFVLFVSSRYKVWNSIFPLSSFFSRLWSRYGLDLRSPYSTTEHDSYIVNRQSQIVRRSSEYQIPPQMDILPTRRDVP